MNKKIISAAAVVTAAAGIGNVVIYGESTAIKSSLYEGFTAVLLDVLGEIEETADPTEEPTETEELEETTEPESTETEEPEETVEPTVTEEPEKTVEPTETEEPEETEEPGETAEPTATAEPTETEEPGETAEPTVTAEPNATEEPEETAEPTVTAEPTATAEPTTEPEPTETPKPSGGGGGGATVEDITVYMTVEKLTLGEGFILEPTAVTVKSDTTAAVLLDKLLGEENYKCSGSPEQGMYLISVKDSETEPQIPQYIAQKLDKIGKRRSNEWLGEFDYTNYSGWKYSVNGKYPGTGASDKKLSDGDVVRWQFTLYGLGADLDYDANLNGTTQLKKLADKRKLIRLVADLRESVGDTKLKRNNSYISALDALAKIDSTQDEVDRAYKQLNNADFSESSGGRGSNVKVSASVSFETRVNEDESETVTASITTSADSFAAELDYNTISRLALKAEKLTVRAGDIIVTVPQSVFKSLKAVSPEKAELSLAHTDNGFSLSLSSDGKMLDIYDIIEVKMPFDAEGYDECVLVTNGGENIKHEYGAGVLKFSAELNREYNMRISPVLMLSDVDANAEYAAALDSLMRRGIVKGAGNNRFEPEAEFSAGMLALMLYRESGYSAEGRAWYVNPMEWATRNGFIKDGNAFAAVNGEMLDTAMRAYLGDKATAYRAPDGEMTRAEAVMYYSRYLEREIL